MVLNPVFAVHRYEEERTTLVQQMKWMFGEQGFLVLVRTRLAEDSGRTFARCRLAGRVVALRMRRGLRCLLRRRLLEVRDMGDSGKVKRRSFGCVAHAVSNFAQDENYIINN
jgi:hypothetical protein